MATTGQTKQPTLAEYLAKLPQKMRTRTRESIKADRDERARRMLRPTKPALDKAARKARNKQARKSRAANRH